MCHAFLVSCACVFGIHSAYCVPVMAKQEISMLWKRNRDDCKWQALFHALFLDQEIPAEVLKQMSTPRRHRKKNGKACTPKTPKSGKKSGKKLETPEKPRQAPKRVQECRPIAFGQPAEKDTMLQKPCKKRRRVGQMEFAPANEGEGEGGPLFEGGDDEDWNGFDVVSLEDNDGEDCQLCTAFYRHL